MNHLTCLFFIFYDEKQRWKLELGSLFLQGNRTELAAIEMALSKVRADDSKVLCVVFDVGCDFSKSAEAEKSVCSFPIHSISQCLFALCTRSFLRPQCHSWVSYALSSYSQATLFQQLRKDLVSFLVISVWQPFPAFSCPLL